MVDKALIFLHQQVNAHLKAALARTDDQIFLSNVVDQDGKSGFQANALGMTLVNIEEEHAMQPNREYVNSKPNELRGSIPGLYVNLYVLVTANYNDYLSALKSLARVLEFFQTHHTFQSDTNSDLQAIGIHHLNIKIQKSSFEAQNQLWGTLGAKYMPSVVYKLRMVQVQSGKLGPKVPVVESVHTNLTKQ